jgi:methylmalonyl-CoA mutase, N-terminal domain
LNVDDFAPRLSFFFNAHNNFFEEAAKYRAVRRMWSKIMKERFKAKNPKSWMLRFHTQTGGSTLTAQQPEVNVVRVAYQALSAVLGGTQSLHTNSKDEALALPTEESARVALRTQQVIAYETGVTDTIDPLAGSYYVESLTDELEKKSWEYIEKIDQLGGAVAAVEQGFMQREIQQSAFNYQEDIENQRRIVVGVNKFSIEEAPHTGLLRVDPNIADKQISRLQEVRASRDDQAVSQALSLLKGAAAGTENVMPFILDAVREYATLGEICLVLRQVYGEYKAAATL